MVTSVLPEESMVSTTVQRAPEQKGGANTKGPRKFERSSGVRFRTSTVRASHVFVVIEILRTVLLSLISAAFCHVKSHVISDECELVLVSEQLLRMSRFDLHSEPPTGTKFHERYKHALVRENLVAYRPVMPSLLKDRLEINVDVIDRNDLLILLHTLVNDDSLISVAFESHLLRDNPQLTHDIMKLHYHSNIRLPVYADPEIMSSICNALYRHLIKNEWCLAVFRLIGIPMTEKHLAAITAAFPAAKSMKILSLEAMPLYHKHMSVLLTSLPLLSSLIILNLSSCGLNSKLVGKFCAFLRDDAKLERLILSSNPLGDNGVAEVAKAVEHNRKFRALDLQNCGITAVGCQALIQLLFSNRSVEVCDIRRNAAVPRESALDIAKIMLENNKNQSKQTCYRPLQLTTTAPIYVDDVPTCAPAEKPRGTLAPRDVSPVKLLSKSRENLISVGISRHLFY